jgi:phosphohistidine swiveling domain-containing protein
VVSTDAYRRYVSETGVPEATSQIPAGAVVTVDGYLGLVTVVQR